MPYRYDLHLNRDYPDLGGIDGLAAYERIQKELGVGQQQGDAVQAPQCQGCFLQCSLARTAEDEGGHRGQWVRNKGAHLLAASGACGGVLAAGLTLTEHRVCCLRVLNQKTRYCGTPLIIQSVRA